MNILHFVADVELEEGKKELLDKYHGALLKIDLKKEEVPFDGTVFLLLVSTMLKSETFNEELWENAYAAMEARLHKIDRSQFVTLFVTCS